MIVSPIEPAQFGDRDFKKLTRSAQSSDCSMGKALSFLISAHDSGGKAWRFHGTKILTPRSTKPKHNTRPCWLTLARRRLEGHVLGWKPNRMPIHNLHHLLDRTSFLWEYILKRTPLDSTALILSGRQPSWYWMKTAKSAIALKAICLRMNLRASCCWGLRVSSLCKRNGQMQASFMMKSCKNIPTALLLLRPCIGKR